MAIDYGNASATDNNGQFSQLSFLIKQGILDVQTAALVIVKGVTNNGGLTPVGSVDIQLMVQQVTGDRKAIDHGIIHNIPYFRIQGGKNAVIIDPEVGDIGVAVFCSRDISAVKATKKIAPPGSHGSHDFEDGLYLGGFLNGVPEQYIQFASGGITLKSPTKITLDAPNIDFIGNINSTGTTKNNGKDNGSTHTHINGGGTGNSGVPS